VRWLGKKLFVRIEYRNKTIARAARFSNRKSEKGARKTKKERKKLAGRLKLPFRVVDYNNCGFQTFW
jgi:hypothetical protein